MSRSVSGRARTASVWGKPSSRYYRVLRRAMEMGAERVAVVGAADGRFVLPFARAGIRTTAIEMDPVALWGGVNSFPGGNARIPGLASRLSHERLSSIVDIREVDLRDVDGPPIHDVVFTSGSLHYPCNDDVPLRDLLERFVGLARTGGYLYIDYMMSLDPSRETVTHLPGPGAVATLLEELGCEIEWQRHAAPRLDRAHVGFPRDHYHRLGYVAAHRRTPISAPALGRPASRGPEAPLWRDGEES